LNARYLSKRPRHSFRSRKIYHVRYTTLLAIGHESAELKPLSEVVKRDNFRCHAGDPRKFTQTHFLVFISCHEDVAEGEIHGHKQIVAASTELFARLPISQRGRVQSSRAFRTSGVAPARPLCVAGSGFITYFQRGNAVHNYSFGSLVVSASTPTWKAGCGGTFTTEPDCQNRV
jgi:hypothetical protein